MSTTYLLALYRPRVSECAGLEGLELWEGFCQPIPWEPPKPPVPAGGGFGGPWGGGGRGGEGLGSEFISMYMHSPRGRRPRKYRGCSKSDSKRGNEIRYARRERRGYEGGTSANEKKNLFDPAEKAESS